MAGARAFTQGDAGDMKKIVIHKPGGYDVLRLEEHPDPKPGPGEVRIRTQAIGVNYADCIVRWGLYESAKKYVGWPITPGFECAGIIDDWGDGAEEANLSAGGPRPVLQMGAPVFAVTRFDAYASHVCVPAHQVFPVPPGFTMEQAAAFPAVFLTAAYALFELVHPRKGERVLIHSAAGGVGGALIQLCRIANLYTVGVVGGTHKIAKAMDLGAHAVIDKSRSSLWKEAATLCPEGFHAIFDPNGASTLQASFEHLASPGKLVIYGFHSMMPKTGGRVNYARLAYDWLRTPRFNPFSLTDTNRSVLAFNLSFLFSMKEVLGEIVEELFAYIENKRLRPPETTLFPFDKVAEAHRAIESGTTTGKLVLVGS